MSSHRRPKKHRLAPLVLLVIALFALVNGGIAAAVPVARAQASGERMGPLAGVGSLHQVDPRVWRGDTPSDEGYRTLAKAGVTTVVDLRAGRDAAATPKALAETGIRRIHLPMRDGGTPSPVDVERFIDAVRSSSGLIYVHGGTGTGGNGTMTATYLVHTGRLDAHGALVRSLAVGPPSVEQIWYTTRLDDGATTRPPAAVSAASRVLDAPRQFWHWLREAVG